MSNPLHPHTDYDDDPERPVGKAMIGVGIFIIGFFIVWSVIKLTSAEQCLACDPVPHGLPSEEEINKEVQWTAEHRVRASAISPTTDPVDAFEILRTAHAKATHAQQESANDLFWQLLEHDIPLMEAYARAEKEIVKCKTP